MNGGTKEGNQVVIVTGANSGIGLATALEAARAGFKVVGSVRSEEKAELLRETAGREGVKVSSVLLDVTDAAECERAVSEVVERYGPPYALVNNAGVGHVAAVEDVDDEEAREILETMVVAPARLARLVLPYMREQKQGRIVNMSSIYGRATTPMSGWYQAAKHALEALSDALRAEVASDGVRVVLVEPGGFRTPLWDDVTSVARENSRHAVSYARTRQVVSLTWPLMGKPEDCARVIVQAPSIRARAISSGRMPWWSRRPRR